MPKVDVFVSHSSQDEAIALQLVDRLEQAGLQCWISCRDIPKGTKWADEIDDALYHSRAFVILVSCHTAQSVHVPKELGLAVDYHLPIFPLRLDATPLTGAFRYYLSDEEWIDGSGDLSAAMQTLSDTLAGTLRPNAAPPQPTGPDEGPSGSPAPGPDGHPAPRPNRRLPRGVLPAAALLVVVLLALTLAFGPGLISQGPDSPPQDTGAAATAEDAGADSLTQVIHLRPNSTVSLSGYQSGVSHLKSRLDQYFGAGVCQITEQDNSLLLSIPLDRFGSYQPDTLFQQYFLPPLELYLNVSGGTRSEFLKLPRSQVTGCSVPDTLPEELQNAGLDADTPVVQVNLSDLQAEAVAGLVAEIQPLATENSPFQLLLCLDYGTDDSHYLDHVFLSQDGSCLWFVEPNRDRRLAELLAGQLGQETFPSVFQAHFAPAVHWEAPSQPADGLSPGQMQQDYAALDPAGLTVAYFAPSEETYGQWFDMRAGLIAALDALEIPYALGTPGTDPNQLAVAVDSSLVNDAFFTVLAGTMPSLSGSTGDSSFWGDLVFSLRTREDGSLALEAAPPEGSLYADAWAELIAQTGDGTLYLNSSSEPIFWGQFQGDTLVLDHSVYSADSGIPDSAVPLLNLLVNRSSGDGSFHCRYLSCTGAYAGPDFWDGSYGPGLANLQLSLAQQAATRTVQQQWGSGALVQLSADYSTTANLWIPLVGELSGQTILDDLHTLTKLDLLDGTYLSGRTLDWLRLSYEPDGSNTAAFRVVLSPDSQGTCAVEIIFWDERYTDLALELSDLIQQETGLWSSCSISHVV